MTRRKRACAGRGSVSAMAEDDPVEALYAASPEGFVAARDALARELRAAGDRAGAVRVRALRRPTRAAWALNAAVRERPDATRAISEAVERLHDAQRALLEGGDAAGPSADEDAGRAGDGGPSASTSDEARRGSPAARLRAAEVAVREAGDELLAGLPVDDPPTVEKARATLRAAAVDADVLADLVAGRLAHDQVASGFGGFGALGDLSLLVPPPSAPRTRRGADRSGRDREKRASAGSSAGDGSDAEQQDAEPERADDAAVREAAERERREREAAEREAAEREAAERRARIEAARAEEDAAEAAAVEAGQVVEEAETTLAALRAQRDAAISRLDAARAARERAEQA